MRPRILFLATLIAAAGLTACAPETSPATAATRLLKSAAGAADVLAAHPDDAAAQATYNQAATDLVLLLRDHDSLWNRPLAPTRDGGYRLDFARRGPAVWDPADFAGFTPAAKVPGRFSSERIVRTGIGGTLVGSGPTHPLPRFSPPDGTAAPVTATITFRGKSATLSLLDPAQQDTFRLRGNDLPLAADFTAPLDHQRPELQLWHGLMGAISVSKYMSDTGLYQLQPYDPNKIPLIFVHGLVSTPQTWRKTIHAIDADPQLRGKYQYWVFRYPTGNPPGYSAMRLRKELQRVAKLHPDAPDYVLVGHSMGGIVSRLQATTVTRESWNVIGRDRARQFFSIVEDGSVGDRATRFEANPKVGRLVFICTPHRGSKLAVGNLGGLLRRLISLPADLSGPLIGTAGNAIAVVSGSTHRLPNSVTGLSPGSSLLKVMNSVPIQAKYHSIIGDRGKGGTPDSSDGVVDYRSATVPGAASELVVPGDHGAQNLPATHDELRRILRLHLRERGR